MEKFNQSIHHVFLRDEQKGKNVSKFLIKTIFNIPNAVRVKEFVAPTPVETLEGNDKFTLPAERTEGKDTYVSYLGTPVYAPLQIKDGSYTLNEKKISYRGIDLKNVLYDVSFGKNVVKTAIQGRNGTVKELISLTDRSVNIKGVLVSPNNEYPEEQVQRLLEICDLQTDIEVVSSYLALFKVYNLVIEDCKFPQREGFRNLQAFELSCVSDSPIEVGINEDLQ
jgi:hypothetical protein